ncbi:2-dehydropantoate 2-reductase [Ectobacillus ponti]|uniref:2-dehydropantoate 2-reductase n=1 Tax=Ectobacillus ponti TaxID=2961894 RepID=A0AA42BS69_9BACI|nr:2-dehydropantoate 2-reductase [Ectobacillus ponti]MCP8970254.1 2-dehydropantoate 2-reductase [Ectobacillus ponti]
MKVGIVGGGAIGLLFAYYIQRAGHAVTVYTRTKEQAAYIQRNGITCIRGEREHTAFPRAVVWGLQIPQDDYLLVAVKQYDIPAVIRHLSDAKSRLVFLQNGMSHVELMQQLRQPAAVGIVEHGAKREGPGTVRHTGPGLTRLGIVSGEAAAFADAEGLFHMESFPFVEENDWQGVLQGKLIVNVCINPLTALYRVSNGALLQNPHLQSAMRQVFLEAAHVLGMEDKEHWERVCHVCEKTAANTSSMLADLQAGRETEIDAIVGYLLGESEKSGKAAPLLSFLYQSVKGLQG